MLIYQFESNGVKCLIQCLNGQTRREALAKAISTLIDIDEDLGALEDKEFMEKSPIIGRFLNGK